jgi:predicted MPP superfamily phosphohydrolase
MRNNPVLILVIFSSIILVIDAYTYWGIRKITHGFSKRIIRIIDVLYWIVPLSLISGIMLVFHNQDQIAGQRLSYYIYYLSGTFIVFYLPKLIFVIFNLFDDVIFQIRKIVTLKRKKVTDNAGSGRKITRRKLLNQVGMVFAGVPFLTLLYGIAYGRFDFTKRKVGLSFPNLPDAFNGFKIVQISDFHIGTFFDHLKQVGEIVQLVNDEDPDLILFTGDMVNNLSTEVDPFLDILSTLKAKNGIYSILGNHDYGEYFPWKSEKDKQDNIERLINLQRQIGFDLLLDESRRIKRAGGVIELIGVQNWGLPPFPQYGDLEKAMKNTDNHAFKLLMSHDPTHWDAQVKERTDIDLMLAGHTHGAQFGVEIPGWRWSPATVRYKQWGGLYSEGSQHLYVNTGLGSIGYPGRVGMPPEITVFELKNGQLT